MDRAKTGARLREARENRGLKQEEVAEALSIPRTAVVKIEAGERSVSTTQIAELARLYCRPVAEFFREHEPEEDDIVVALYRLAPGLEASPQVRNEVLRAVGIFRAGVSLEGLLGGEPRSGPPLYRLPFPSHAMSAVGQGTDVAEEERERLGLGKAPIADMAELLGSQGIWAAGAVLPQDMSGLFLSHSSIGMAVLVNYAHARPRKRFSYAHEYAHALLDRDRSVTVSTAENSEELIEKRANAFAAAFLMPHSGVRAQLHQLGKGLPSRQEQPVYSVADDRAVESRGRPPARSQEITYQDVATIGYHFGVSYQAAVYRLRSLNVLTQRECQNLLTKENLGRRFVRLLESREMDVDEKANSARSRDDRELVRQVSRLAVEAYRREQISRGRLLEFAKMLEIRGKELLALAEAAREG